MLGLSSLLVLPLTLTNLALQQTKLVLECIHLPSLLFSHARLLDLFLDLLKLLSLFRKCKFLVLVNLPLESNHILLELIELRFILVSFSRDSCHLSLQINDFNLLLGQLVTQHIYGTLFNRLLIGNKLGISINQSSLKVIDLDSLALVACFQLLLLILESLLNREHFLFLVDE